MNPEERQLLERSLKLAEENNHILHKLHRAYRWSFFWGFVKIALIVVPLVLGYFYLEPFLKNAQGSFSEIQEVFSTYQSYIK